MSHSQKFKQQFNRRKESPNDIRSALEHSERTHEASEITDKKVYITVPYDDRTTAKMLGAKWNDEFKSWYALPNFENYQQLIRRYPYVEKTYLYVSYDDKNIAKSMGAYFCGVNKRWYAPKPKEQIELIKRFGSLPKVKKSIQLINTTEKTKLIQPESPNEVEIMV